MQISGDLIIKRIIVAAIICLAIGCSSNAINKTQKESFYIFHENYRPIPLIYPLELYSQNGSPEWSIPGNLALGEKLNISARKIDSVGVKYPYILIHAEHINMFSEKYIIYNILNDSKTLHHNSVDFKGRLSSLNLSMNLYETESLYFKWKETGRLPWDTISLDSKGQSLMQIE